MVTAPEKIQLGWSMRIISLPLVGLMVTHISQEPGSALRSSFPTLMEFSFPQTTRCCSAANTC